MFLSAAAFILNSLRPFVQILREMVSPTMKVISD